MQPHEDGGPCGYGPTWKGIDTLVDGAGTGSPVAGVRQGDRALSYHLRDGVVETVKLSHVDLWGDDEGCA